MSDPAKIPPNVRVKYAVYVTSDLAECTFIGEIDTPTVPFSTLDGLRVHVERATAQIIDAANRVQGVRDFRPMTMREVEMYVAGVHPHCDDEAVKAATAMLASSIVH